ncbi:MAG: LLM class flavin-dependent oxidoreductase [Nitrososphaerota archaeon]|nr:LLM class flavin-dependent oxidoreductase [Nitrososphaerota archaeon]
MVTMHQEGNHQDKEAVSFGVYLPIYDSESNLDLAIESAMSAERNRFSSVWSCDHLMGVDSVVKDDSTPGVLHGFTLLSFLAAKTNRVILGGLAAAPYWNPLVLAKTASTLDLLSKGRAAIAVGAGWRKREFYAAGLPFENFSMRLQRTKETIEILRGLWKFNEFSYAGKLYDIHNASLLPKPVQRNGPKIWLIGSGEKITKLAPLTDGWFPPALSAEDYDMKSLEIKKIVSNPNFDFAMELYTCCAASRSQAFDTCKRFCNRWFGASPEQLFDTTSLDHVNELDTSPMRGRKIGVVIGSYEDCSNQLQNYARVGVRNFILHFMDSSFTTQGIEGYSDHIIPTIAQ